MWYDLLNVLKYVFPKIINANNSTGFSIVNHPFWGTPLFQETPIWIILAYCQSGSLSVAWMFQNSVSWACLDSLHARRLRLSFAKANLGVQSDSNFANTKCSVPKQWTLLRKSSHMSSVTWPQKPAIQPNPTSSHIVRFTEVHGSKYHHPAQPFVRARLS